MLSPIRTPQTPGGFPDGIRPVFLEVGAAPTAGNAPYPPGSVVRFGTLYYLNVGTLATPSWAQISTVVAQNLTALSGIAKLTAGVFSAATAGTDYSAGTAALGTGLIKSTTGTGALSVAAATGDPPDFVGPSQDRRAKIAAYADSLISFTDPFELFDDELNTLWTEANTASGTRKKSGISSIELAATAAAGDVAAILWGTNMGSAGFPVFVKGGAAGKFFCEWRFRMTTAVDAQAFNLFGDDTVNAWGLRGATSTAFWVARFDNGPTVLTSTIPVDNGTFHRFRVYRDGTTGFFQVDSETPVSAAAAFLSVDARLMLRLGNGTTAAARKAEWDYVFVRGERP